MIPYHDAHVRKSHDHVNVIGDFIVAFSGSSGFCPCGGRACAASASAATINSTLHVLAEHFPLYRLQLFDLHKKRSSSGPMTGAGTRILTKPASVSYLLSGLGPMS
jgi:hypothetical protein